MMQFSVLLSVYYKENPAFLKDSLSSLFNQRCLPNEVVLVEDGALTHELSDVISDFAGNKFNVKIIKLSSNQGLGKALNEGLKYCSYDLIARMDTDDIAKPDRFEKQIKVFQEHPEVDVVGAWIDEFEKDISHVTSVRKLPELQKEIFSYAQKRNPINHPVVMFRKQVVMAVGGYQHFPLFEDYYLWVRMLMNGAKFYNIQESLLYFRTSPAMFKRRGGLKYMNTEIHFQNFLLKSHFITLSRYIRNIIIRIMVRIVPNSLRGILYKRILRN